MQVLFPDMFIKIFDTMGVSGGGYISQTCSSKIPFFLPVFFFSNRLGVDADVSGRLGTQDDRNFRKSWKIGKFSDFSENFPQWQILQIIKF